MVVVDNHVNSLGPAGGARLPEVLRRVETIAGRAFRHYLKADILEEEVMVQLMQQVGVESR